MMSDQINANIREKIQNIVIFFKSTMIMMMI